MVFEVNLVTLPKYVEIHKAVRMVTAIDRIERPIEM